MFRELCRILLTMHGHYIIQAQPISRSPSTASSLEHCITCTQMHCDAMQAGVLHHAVATACCIPCASLGCKQAPLLDGPPLAYGINAGRDVKPSVSNISRSSLRSLLGVVSSLSPSKMLFAPAMKQSACG